jgi:hypothetical protein
VPLSTAHQKVLEEWMRSKAVVMCPFFTCGTFGPERGSPARAYAALTGERHRRGWERGLCRLPRIPYFWALG